MCADGLAVYHRIVRALVRRERREGLGANRTLRMGRRGDQGSARAEERGPKSRQDQIQTTNATRQPIGNPRQPSVAPNSMAG
jgi:hypothetical protein